MPLRRPGERTRVLPQSADKGRMPVDESKSDGRWCNAVKVMAVNL